MEKIISPRGTKDILAPESFLWQFIEAKAMEIFNLAGFEEIRTPIFEHTQLFSRAVGESSDIVNKEMYTFSDRSDRSITLRPEGTAGVVRAYIEHSMDRASRPQKLWYRGPMFRYERPQTGRYRQFHQIGIEAIGSESPYLDLELIKLAYDFLSSLGLANLSLAINSIGNAQSREAYKKELLSFLSEHQDHICEDCKRRMTQNPLRVLDCKVPEDQKLYENAPAIDSSLDEDSRLVFQKIKDGLEALKINYIVDPSLVRGLDYYSHCVFEFKTDDKVLGQQGTVLAGGRYDNLVSDLGASSASPAVGWALGVERIAFLLSSQLDFSKRKKIFIVSDLAIEAAKLALRLRKDTSIITEYDFDSAKIGKQLEKAEKRAASFAIFYLEDERQSSKFTLKNLDLEKGHPDKDKEFSSYEELILFLNEENLAKAGNNNLMKGISGKF